ncbi:MAG: hypothetical protein AB1847_14975 [bacterium]
MKKGHDSLTDLPICLGPSWPFVLHDNICDLFCTLKDRRVDDSFVWTTPSVVLLKNAGNGISPKREKAMKAFSLFGCFLASEKAFMAFLLRGFTIALLFL